MSAKPDGGPAFPGIGEIPIHPDQAGMSLRDYFAGHALQAYIANQNHFAAAHKCKGEKTIEQVLAIMAYAAADAMISKRSES